MKISIETASGVDVTGKIIELLEKQARTGKTKGLIVG